MLCPTFPRTTASFESDAASPSYNNDEMLELNDKLAASSFVVAEDGDRLAYSRSRFPGALTLNLEHSDGVSFGAPPMQNRYNVNYHSGYSIEGAQRYFF